ncbi:hypothetical protein HK098_006082 [Nowakowskiella sp. JEL0407]|nr:hypothetical protein HK098_006082 [Nowakowskiella sp. JEL0407]
MKRKSPSQSSPREIFEQAVAIAATVSISVYVNKNANACFGEYYIDNCAVSEQLAQLRDLLKKRSPFRKRIGKLRDEVIILRSKNREFEKEMRKVQKFNERAVEDYRAILKNSSAANASQSDANSSQSRTLLNLELPLKPFLPSMLKSSVTLPKKLGKDSAIEDDVRGTFSEDEEYDESDVEENGELDNDEDESDNEEKEANLEDEETDESDKEEDAPSEISSQEGSIEERLPSKLCRDIHKMLNAEHKTFSLGCNGILDLAAEATEKYFKGLPKATRSNIGNKFKEIVKLPDLGNREKTRLANVINEMKDKLDEGCNIDLETDLEEVRFSTARENRYRRTAQTYLSNMELLTTKAKEKGTDEYLANFLSTSILKSPGWIIEPGELMSDGSMTVRNIGTEKFVGGQKLDLRVTIEELSFEPVIALRSGGITTTKKKKRCDKTDLAIAMRDNMLKFRSENHNVSKDELDQVCTYGIHTHGYSYDIYGLCAIEDDVFAFGLLFRAKLPMPATKIDHNHALDLLEKVIYGAQRLKIAIANLETLAKTVSSERAKSHHKNKKRRLTDHMKQNPMLNEYTFKLNKQRPEKSQSKNKKVKVDK